VPRNILFITTDQQRYDSLGCNGNQIARTPVVDRLAAEGINYRRAYNQNTVCMPARSTMLTGQYVSTHGVFANGVALPVDAPSIAAYLAEQAGYRTALLGKAHFEPGFDPGFHFEENARAARGDIGPWRGFERSIQVMHTAAFYGTDASGQDFALPVAHYGRWLQEHHPEHLRSFAPLLSGESGGDTGAPETKNNPIPRGWYHTDWIADLVIDWLDSLPADDHWFCWMSFPDPHHPWDPPESELARVPWRDLDLPPGHPGSADKVREVLAQKPAHWLGYWEGTWRNREGGPARFCPGTLSDDQIREINAKTHVMNELIDEACGRVLARIGERGWTDTTDVFFTTDHGELQGDFGLIYKGPFHTDALMRLPLVWRPAPSAGVAPAVLDDPVGQLDLAPTFCSIAGVPVPDWIEGRPLPVASDAARERVLCEWDSQFPGYGMHLRSIYRDGWLCTAYLPSTDGVPNGLEAVMGERVLKPCGVHYDGTEGELYNVDEDPHQFRNLWDDAGYEQVRKDLVTDLLDSLPAGRETPLPVVAPA
jgi:arylsulfatase A-like enzyme